MFMPSLLSLTSLSSENAARRSVSRWSKARRFQPRLETLEAKVTPSHFRYGTLSWDNTEGNTVVFRIEQAYRNFGPFQVGNVVNVGSLVMGDGSSKTINLTVTSITGTNTNTDVYFGVATITHTYATPGNKSVSFASCCRISTLQNNRDGNYRTETVVNVGTLNKSPVSSLPPIVQVPDNQIATFQVPGIDPNGAAINYRLSTSNEAGPGFTQPAGLAISSTGLITWDIRDSVRNTVPGHLWSVQVMLEDGQTKTPVDFIIQIGQPAANNQPPTVAANPAGPFRPLPGQQIQFTVTATDLDGTIANLQALNAPQGMMLTQFVPGNPSSRTVTFTPTAQQVNESFVVTFQATDNQGATGQTSVTISPAANQPPTAVILGPQAVTLDESTPTQVNTHTLLGFGIDPEGTPVTYAWDLDGDGTFETPGVPVLLDHDNNPATPPISGSEAVFVAGNGPDIRLVQLQVTDAPDGFGATRSTVSNPVAVQVDNLDPQVMVAANPNRIAEDGIVTLVIDVLDNPHDHLSRVEIDWGDGTVEDLADDPNFDPHQRQFIVSHRYLDDDPSETDSDDYQAMVTVEDDDGGRGDAAAAVTVDNVPPRVGPGSVFLRNCGPGGLRGLYFDHDDFSGAAATRIDPVINFDAGFGQFHPQIDGDTFSVIWEGCVRAPAAGDYTFFVRHDDGIRLFLDGLLAIDQFDPTPPVEHASLPIRLQAGELVPIRLEYYENFGLAVAQLSWQGPGIPKEIIPPENLLQPTFGGIIENGPFQLSGTIHDPGSLDPHTVTIDWQDGSEPTVLQLAAGEINFQAVHTYLDDNPTGTPADSYNVTITVVDDDLGQDEFVFPVVVVNQPPRITAITDDHVVNEGDMVHLAAAFADDGPQDAHLLDWTVFSTNGQQVPGGDGLAFSFMAENDGFYFATFTVTDDDGGIDQRTVVVEVRNIAPFDLDIGPDQTALEGDTVHFTSSFSDPGADQHQFLWLAELLPSQEDEEGDEEGEEGEGELGELAAFAVAEPLVVAFGTDRDFAFVPPDDGLYRVTFFVFDGTDASSVEAMVAVGNQPPVADAGPDAQAFEGDLVALFGSFADPGIFDTHMFGWEVFDLAGNLIHQQPGQDLFFFAADNGVYRAVFTVTDSDGASSSDEALITVANVPPQNVTAGPDQEVEEGTPVGFFGFFTDPGILDQHQLNWHVDSSNGQPVADGDGLDFQFTPLDDGLYLVTFTVFDGDDASQVVVQVLVRNAPPFGVDAGPDQMVLEGENVHLAGSFGGDPGLLDTHNFSWVVTDAAGNEVARGDGPQLAFTPPDDGVYVATFTVTDKDKGSSADQALILVGNRPPLIFINGRLWIPVNQEYVIDLSSADFGADRVFAWTVDWGDGSQPETFPSAGEHTLRTHVFTVAPAANAVQVIAHDEDGDFPALRPFVVAVRSAEITESAATFAPAPLAGEPPPVVTAIVSGVNAAFTNNTPGSEPATIFVADYIAPPDEIPQAALTNQQTVALKDIKVDGADLSDTLVVTFYYPNGITGAAENRLQLKFFDPVLGRFVLAQSGVQGPDGTFNPIKDETDVVVNGIAYGGSFTMTFNAQSMPLITGLTGTVFTISVQNPAPTPPVNVQPPVAALPLNTRAANDSPFASRATSFTSNSQLSLSLTASADSRATASRTVFDASTAGRGEEMKDAAAAIGHEQIIEWMLMHGDAETLWHYLQAVGEGSGEGKPAPMPNGESTPPAAPMPGGEGLPPPFAFLDGIDAFFVDMPDDLCQPEAPLAADARELPADGAALVLEDSAPHWLFGAALLGFIRHESQERRERKRLVGLRS